MSQQLYSAHPALAAEQLQRAELETCRRQQQQPQQSQLSGSAAPSGSSRRHVKATPKKYTASRSCAGSSSKENSTTTPATISCNRTASQSQSLPLPARTNYAAVDDDDDIDCEDVDDVNFGKLNAEQAEIKIIRLKPTKDCAASVSVDEVDHVQQRFKRHSRQTTSQHQLAGGGGSISDLSSVLSSPSASTVSSPLSTPTRLAPQQLQLQQSHQHCCQKSTAAEGAAGAATARQPPQQQQQQPASSHRHQHHLHQQQQQQHHTTTCGGGGGVDAGSAAGVACKNKKLDPRFSPSPYRQLLPIALCLLSFATVFATLIVYMDTTEIRHQQFRLNMSRDYELNSVAQDDPALIAFLRQIHMRKYPMHLGKSGLKASPVLASVDGFGNSSSSGGVGGGGAEELAPAMAHYVADLVGGKEHGGAVIQSLTGPLAHLITAPWLSEQLNWMGVLVEPEPRWYFALRKQNAQRTRMQVVHACVSPNPYPKEITIHNEDVRINSLHDEETSWFNSRVKCFPLYTIMLACERTEYDLLSLGVQGHELEILQTLPFDKVNIDVISIHLLEDHEDVRDYVQSITKFLAGKSYKLQRKFGRNFFYQRLNAASRTRKKDILLLKTP